ncbi:hypothetical protein RD792_012997, partial [Penstemon davidsonii]
VCYQQDLWPPDKNRLGPPLDPPTYGVKTVKILHAEPLYPLKRNFARGVLAVFEWLECTTDSNLNDSCGFSCHIECALLRERNEDGSYCCARCNRISFLIRSWKKQLIIAKDCHLVKEFCYRILLSFRLLNGSSKYKELHKLVEEIKGHLEEEFNSPLHEYEAGKREIVNRLSSARKLQHQLLPNAIENADKLLSANSNLIPICDVDPQNFTVTELGSGSGSGFKVNNTLIDLSVPLVPDLNKVPNEFLATKKSGLDDNFEKIVNTICCLEREGHIREVFRKKFLTWFSLKAGDQGRRIVFAFQQAMADTPTSLADQLIDTFSDVIFN